MVNATVARITGHSWQENRWKVKIKNTTHWRTRDLRRIATRVVREELPRERFNDRARGYTVYVGYNRGGPRSDGSCSGNAPYHGNWCTVNVPSGCVDPVDFAHVLGHELGHSKGLHHGHMPPHQGRRGDYSEAHYAWAKALVIAKQPVKKRMRPSVDNKLAHAERMVKLATTRAKRAATLLKRWQQKVRYYSRRSERLAACKTESSQSVQSSTTVEREGV